MRSRFRPALAAAAMLAFAVAAPAVAQGPVFGPPIPGLCLLSRASIMNGTRAGQSLHAQIGRMQAALGAQLGQQRAQLGADERALQAQQATIPPVEYQRRLADLNRRAQALAEAERSGNAALQAAQARGQQQVDGALNTALGRIVTRARCSLVTERDITYGWNNQMDITADVVREMDSVLQAVAL